MARLVHRSCLCEPLFPSEMPQKAGSGVLLPCFRLCNQQLQLQQVIDGLRLPPSRGLGGQAAAV